MGKMFERGNASIKSTMGLPCYIVYSSTTKVLKIIFQTVAKEGSVVQQTKRKHFGRSADGLGKRFKL